MHERLRRYRVTDIAAQAGLSRATVDRVLHGRAGVRPETMAQVERAIAELERQRTQVHLSSRAIIFDLVMQAPERFAAACRSALESELQALRPAVARARFHIGGHSDPAQAAMILGRIADRGSQGVILKAPNHPEVVEAMVRLKAVGIPSVTFVTDIPTSDRSAYVGVDNLAAGATAAYLLTHWAGSRGAVLLTLSHSSFQGEEEREHGFLRTLGEPTPSAGPITAPGRRSGSRLATATGHGSGTPTPARSRWESQSSARGRTSPAGCWSGAAGRSGR